eukprot:3550457-Pleurochrysis_carterae.AAC.2
MPLLGCRNERWWRYIYDPDMVDPKDPYNKVRVIYKTNLTDKATNNHAEFKPHVPASADGAQMQTDPIGIQFMLAVPGLHQDPGVEVWRGEEGEEGWKREKVEHDVLEVAAEDGGSKEQ